MLLIKTFQKNSGIFEIVFLWFFEVSRSKLLESQYLIKENFSYFFWSEKKITKNFFWKFLTFRYLKFFKEKWKSVLLFQRESVNKQTKQSFLDLSTEIEETNRLWISKNEWSKVCFFRECWKLVQMKNLVSQEKELYFLNHRIRKF